MHAKGKLDTRYSMQRKICKNVHGINSKKNGAKEPKILCNSK